MKQTILIAVIGILVSSTFGQTLPTCTACNTTLEYTTCGCGWDATVLSRHTQGNVNFETYACSPTVGVYGTIADNRFRMNISDARRTYAIGSFSVGLLSCNIEIMFNNLIISYDEISFTPSIKCGTFDFGGFPKMVLRDMKRCKASTCSECSSLPGCGWCDSFGGSCRAGNTTSDYCNSCPSWSGKQCAAVASTCVNRCSGHGICVMDNVTQQSSCKCDRYWLGTDCATFANNSASACSNVELHQFTLPLMALNTEYVASFPLPTSYVAAFGIRMESPSTFPAGTEIRIRNRAVPTTDVYDYMYILGDKTTPIPTTCLGDGGGFDVVINRPLHGMRQIWITLRPPGVTTTPSLIVPDVSNVGITFSVAACTKGYAGHGCVRFIRTLSLLDSQVNVKSLTAFPVYFLKDTPYHFEVTVPQFSNSFVLTLSSSSAVAAASGINIQYSCEWGYQYIVQSNVLSVNDPISCTYGQIVIMTNVDLLTSMDLSINICPENKFGPACNVDVESIMITQSAFRFVVPPLRRRLFVIDVIRNAFRLDVDIFSNNTAITVRACYGSLLATPAAQSSKSISVTAPMQGTWFLDIQSNASTTDDVGVSISEVLCDPTPCGSTHTSCTTANYVLDYPVHYCQCAPRYIYDKNMKSCVSDGSSISNPATSPSQNTNGGSADDNTRNAIIIAVVAAVVCVVGGIVGWRIWRNRMRRTTSSGAAGPAEHVDDDDEMNTKGPDGK